MEAIIAHEVRGNSGDYVTPKAIEATGIDDVAPIVFIIDGDIAVRQSFALLIRTAGWDPEPFASAEEFLSHPRGTVPCCVILDLTLPGVYAAVRRLSVRRTARPSGPVRPSGRDAAGSQAQRNVRPTPK